MTNNKNVHIDVVLQLKTLLNSLSSEQYTKTLQVLNGSSLGQHARHVIEFYICLIKGINTGIVDYDARERDLLIENDIIHATQTLNDICCKIDSEIGENVNLQLAVSYSNNEKMYVPTNMQRELIYLIEHSIHHYALLKIGVKQSFSDIELPHNFGVAYSTVYFHEHN